jgi:AraC family transcriptional regulator
MQLASGTYLGTITREVKCEDVRVSCTTYDAGQEQPWHVHEHPTFFLHLHGDHVDGSPEGDWVQPRLTATYHPAREFHRSRIGEHPARGMNFEVTEAWLADYGIVPKKLGRQRIVGSTVLRDAGLLAFSQLRRSSDPVEIESVVFGMIEPFVLDSVPHERGAAWLRRADDRLHEQFKIPISLRDLAHEAAVHPVYFARAFRARHRCSVAEYIQKLRLQCAADLVLAGVPIGVAAAEAGFADQFHFSRLLSRHYGIAPTALKEYRTGLYRRDQG